jgi:DNA-binding MarR family transcriptional regulator
MIDPILEQRIIEYIRENPGCYILDVAMHLGMDLGDMADMVKKLLTEGRIGKSDEGEIEEARRG